MDLPGFEHVRLTSRQRTAVLVLVFLGNVLPIALATMIHRESHPAAFFVGVAVGVVAPIGVTITPPHLLPVRWLFAYGGLVGLTLMQAHSGGAGSPYAVLLSMPMIWFGVFATPGELRGGIATVVVCCYLPMLIAPGAYPRDLGQATLLAFVVTAVALSLGALRRETRRLTGQLRRDATHDQLTGLLNRRGWDNRAERSLPTTGQGAPAVVALLDLDRLKEINDGLGHDEGDRVLKQTGALLGDAFRDQPAVCRLGGDEFAVLIVGATLDEAQARFERVQARTSERGRFSAGIAAMLPGERLGDMMRRADLALYEAKTTGRGRTFVAGSLPVERAPADAREVHAEDSDGVCAGG